MIILDVNKVTKSYGFGEILDEVSFSVNDGERVAIVGENGCGKSTLLKIIAKIEDKDGGTISTKKDTILEYLEQGDVLDTQSGKCVDIINSAFSNLFKIDEELKELENKMCDTKDENELNSFVKRYCALNEKFTSLGGYEIKIKVDMVFNGLKIDKNLLERDFSTLSGGERTLINLARILLSNPNLLLLDEPTNHLDISRIEWLESYINNFKGTIIVVSHDRRFLDKVARKIIELENGKIKTYVGNYSQYLQQKEDEEVKEFEIYKVQQKKIKAMKCNLWGLSGWLRW